MSSEKQTATRKGVSGLAFVGCLMIGLAAGILTGNVAVGVLGGIGVGFVLMAIVALIAGQW